MFKDMLEKALVDGEKIDHRNSPSAVVYRDFKDEFSKLVGEPIIWKTKHNTNIKAPQLVIVEKTYDNYVLVVKTSFSVDGEENRIRYGVMYASLYCGFDEYETLEFS